MAQYGILLREQQTPMLEGSPSNFGYSIYPSPDRYKQNSIDLNLQMKNSNPNYYGRSQSFIDEQNYLLKVAAAKEIQENNINILNNVNYNSAELWDEIGNTSDHQAYVQNAFCSSYYPQKNGKISQPQNCIMTYGNITPISPNHNKLLVNSKFIPRNKMVDGSSFISDINSPAFKKNIDIIQHQSKLINNNIENSVLALSSSLSIPDLKAINSGKLNLISDTNNEEIMAVNTLLGPKNNIDNTSLLNDVVMIPNSISSISQESLLPAGNLQDSSELVTIPFVQNNQKINEKFLSPVLSPTISQICPSNSLAIQSKTLIANPKVLEYEKVNKLRSHVIPSNITSIERKTNKASRSLPTANLKKTNQLSIKTNIVNNNMEESLVHKTDINVNISKEKDARLLDDAMTQNININISKQPSDLLFSKPVLVEEPLEDNTLIVTANTNKLIPKVSSTITGNDDYVNSILVKVPNKRKEEKSKKVNKSQSEVIKMEIERHEAKKEEIPKEETNIAKNSESKLVSLEEEKKKIKTFKTGVKSKIEEAKKKNKENLLPEKSSKSISEKEVKSKSSSTKKSENSKRDANGATFNNPPKKRQRFSAKNVNHDPAAIEAHLLLKRKRNTEAARRSRQRKVLQMKNLEETVEKLTKELEKANSKITEINMKYEKVVEESRAYKAKINILEEELKKYKQ